MRLNLDALQMRACMDLWRNALTLPQEGHAQIQHALLERVTATVSGWSDLLHLCHTDAHHEAALEQLKAEVARFKTWIDDAALACTLAGQVQAQDGDALVVVAAKKRRARCLG